jgi:hypothetical protein
MEKFAEKFHCKLFNKETILNWGLPEEVRQQLGISEFEYFFLTSAKEDSHKGHKHVHLSIFPTNFETVKLLEVETSRIDPKILHKVLETVVDHKFEILTSTGTCKKKNECYFGVFFSIPQNFTTEGLIEEIRKIKEVKAAKVYNFSCDGYCEE